MAITLDDFLEGSNLLGNLGVLHAGGSGLGHLQLALVEGFALHLPLCLESSHNVLVLPANLTKKKRLKSGIIFMVKVLNFVAKHGNESIDHFCVQGST